MVYMHQQERGAHAWTTCASWCAYEGVTSNDASHQRHKCARLTQYYLKVLLLVPASFVDGTSLFCCLHCCS
jgi:hypothetical protein